MGSTVRDKQMQRTLAQQAVFKGVGGHTSSNIMIVIHPAPADHGIIFYRSDLDQANGGQVENAIKAQYDAVVNTTMCTVIANAHGASISTIEHLIAALWGCGIDNALIAVDGPEIPIMDGSSKCFIDTLQKIGTIEQNQARLYIKLIKPIRVESGDKFVELLPNDDCNGLLIDMTIDFTHPSIGVQTLTFDDRNDLFCEKIGGARTFGFIKDLETLQARGCSKGASLENAIGLDETKILNPEGLRYDDEFVRHKILDCIGDMYLTGHRLICKIKAHKSGHSLHNDALKALFADPHSYIKE